MSLVGNCAVSADIPKRRKLQVKKMIYCKETEQEIRERAYFIWEFRQENDEQYIVGKEGNLREITAQDDWLQAEEEIIGDRSLW